MVRKVLTLVFLSLVAVACGGSAGGTPNSLKLMAHDSFADAVDDETFAAFTEETGIEVEVIAAGDAGSMVNQAILTKDNPLADVIFGIDDSFLSRALDNGILRSHESSGLGSLVDGLDLDPSHRATPIDYGDVCINYDIAWFEERQVDPPESLDDLRTAIYASFLTVEHPATSSPGLAFVLATIEEYGEDGWLDFWRDLKANGARIAPDWDTAYYGDFTRYGGSSSMVVSYASSPPAEVIFAEEPLDQAPTAVLTAGCYRQVEFAGVLEGTSYPGAAGRLIDYMLSKPFQETIPLTWFVFPANEEAALPDEFVAYTTVPESPAQLDPEAVDENRDRWIDEWVSVMEG